MSRHPLDPAFSKVCRAKAHIKDLDIAVEKFLGAKPYRVEPKTNRKRTLDVWSIVPEAVPLPIECIAADAIHNLRTPLDKMLSVKNAGLHERGANIHAIKFPFGDDLHEFKDALRKQKKHLTWPVIKFLLATRAYPGGRGELLHLANKLDNGDKHRTLLHSTKLALGVTRNLEAYRGYGPGQLFTVGSRRGRHVSRAADGTLKQAVEELAPIYRVGPPPYLELTSAHDDLEVMTTSPGMKMEVNLQVALSVTFSEVGAFEAEPVVNLIETMREVVEATLVAFRDRFF